MASLLLFRLSSAGTLSDHLRLVSELSTLLVATPLESWGLGSRFSCEESRDFAIDLGVNVGAMGLSREPYERS